VDNHRSTGIQEPKCIAYIPPALVCPMPAIDEDQIKPLSPTLAGPMVKEIVTAHDEIHGVLSEFQPWVHRSFHRTVDEVKVVGGISHPNFEV
jgi:hypothetical protein